MILANANLRTKIKTTIYFLATLSAGFSFALLQTASSAPLLQEINFQGKIVNKDDGTNLVSGSPSCVVAGADTCDFRVGIYTASSGGIALWTEIHQNIELGDHNGIFNLSVGEICNTSLGGSWDSDPGADPNNLCTTSGGGFNWDEYTNLYLQVEFDDDGNGDFSSPETFSRKEVTSTAYAFRAETSVSSESVINNTGVITFDDVNTLGPIDFSDATYTALPGGYNSVLHALAAASGGGGLWTINGNVTYLTSAGSDLSLSSTLVSSFSVDESENLVRIGYGASGNGKLDFHSSTGDTARFEYTLDLLTYSGGDFRIADDLEFILGSDNDIKLLYDETTDDRLEIVNNADSLIASIDYIGTDAEVLIDGNLTLGTTSSTGTLRFSDGSSNTITVVAPALAADYTLTLPTTDGNVGEFLQTNGTGALTWATSTFNVLGDSGTQAINAGDNLTFVGGTAINTTSQATDQVLIDFDTSANLNITGDWEFQDIEQLLFGTDSDLRLAFDGTDSLIFSDGTNILFSIIDVGITGRIRIGSSANDILSIGSVGIGATGDLYFGDDLLCDVSESNCGWAAGMGGLFTDGGAVTYLTQTDDDLAIGGNTLASPFSVDVDGNIVRIGDGVNDTNDARLMFYASDATNDGTIAFRDSDRFELVGADLMFQDDRSAIFGSDSDIQIVCDETTNNRLEFSDGTNLLLALTDNTNQGDVLITGDLDIDGNLFNLGTTGTGDATINLFANDGDTGVLTYTTNDRIELTGGGFLIADEQFFTFGTDSDFNIAYHETTDNRLEITDSASNLIAAITDVGTTGGIMVTDDFYVNSIDLNDSGIDNITSAASILGVYDEFVNSTGTNIQTVLKDLDTAIAGGGSLFLSSGGITYRSDSVDDFVLEP